MRSSVGWNRLVPFPKSSPLLSFPQHSNSQISLIRLERGLERSVESGYGRLADRTAVEAVASPITPFPIVSSKTPRMRPSSPIHAPDVPSYSRIVSATPRRPQSVAALLPEEIVDLVFAQLGLDYSMDARYWGRIERCTVLGRLSVVTEGWIQPARRLLCRTVTITKWVHLQGAIAGWAGKGVRCLEIGSLEWGGPQAANAVFELLKKLPDLRQLRLNRQRFESFGPSDSASMQSTVFLPHLNDLWILSTSSSRAPHSIVLDLLATSDHGITRLSVHGSSGAMAASTGHRQLDFRGRLRLLNVGQGFYDTLLDPQWTLLGGLVGLEELRLDDVRDRFTEREGELYRVISPSLRTLRIVALRDLTRFANVLPLLGRLSRLSIAHSGADPSPLLYNLPSSLTFLRLTSDDHFGPILTRWAAKPTLVPVGLKHIHIEIIYFSDTFERLPRIEQLSTANEQRLAGNLRLSSPGALPFKTIEVRFINLREGALGAVQAECSRLGLKFVARMKPFDD